MPSIPKSTAFVASATVWMPLRMIGPSQCFLRNSRSSHSYDQNPAHLAPERRRRTQVVLHLVPEFVPHDLPEDWIGEADLNAHRVGFQERVVRVVLVFGAPTEDLPWRA